MKRSVGFVAGLFAAGLMTTAASAAETKFAHFNSMGSINDFKFINGSKALITNYSGLADTSAAGTTAQPVNVMFNYENIALSSLGQLAASLTFSASTTQAATSNPGGMRDEMGFVGSFSFSYVGTLQIGDQTFIGTAATPINLLSATFNHGDLNGVSGTQSANYTDSTSYLVDPDDDDSPSATDATRVIYTSDLLDFGNTINRDYGLTFNPVTPSVGLTNGSFRNFQAVASGDFSSDPAPLVIAGVPESATWAMMLIGFAAVGATLRAGRRQNTPHNA